MSGNLIKIIVAKKIGETQERRFGEAAWDKIKDNGEYVLISTEQMSLNNNNANKSGLPIIQKTGKSCNC